MSYILAFILYVHYHSGTSLFSRNRGIPKPNLDLVPNSGPIPDHFCTLVWIRTKSGIPDLFGHTVTVKFTDLKCNIFRSFSWRHTRALQMDPSQLCLIGSTPLTLGVCLSTARLTTGCSGDLDAGGCWGMQASANTPSPP